MNCSSVSRVLLLLGSLLLAARGARATTYHYVSSGSCVSNGYAIITTQADCNSGYTALGFGLKVSFVNPGASYGALGCIRSSYDGLYLYTTGVTSTNCNNMDGYSNTYYCICKSAPSCPAGQTGAPGSCTNCVEGTYKDVTGSDACTACPSGSTSPTGSDAVEDCVPAPTTTTTTPAPTTTTTTPAPTTTTTTPSPTTTTTTPAPTTTTTTPTPTTTTTTPTPTTTTTTPSPTTTTTTPSPTTTTTTPTPTTTTTTPTPTTTTTTPTPTKTVMAHQEYYKQCPSNSNTLGAGKNRLQDCLCAENYFRNSSDFCVPCAYGYQKQGIGNFNCSCYVFDSCDPPVCNGDGSSCRPLLVVSESDGGGFGLSEVLVGDFEDLSLTDTIDIEAETAKQGFEFTSDGSQLISGTSIATTQVVNGTTKTSITNVILRQNRLTDEVQIKIIPVQNEAIKATAVSPIDDNVLVFGGERNVYMYDENEEKIIKIASVEDDNMQTVDVSTSDAQGGRIAIAYSLDFFNTSNSSISRRRLLQDATSDLCGSVEHFTANFVSETNAKSYKICQPHSVALYTSGDTNVDYILVGTPCRIVRINLDRTGNAKYAKTLLGPGEPDQNCQEGDFGDASIPVSGIRFQDARKILVDKSGGEIFVFDKNHLRKIAMKEDQVSGITTVETFADEDIDSITNMALSPDDGSILFARNQEVQITVNASTGAQQPRLENKLQRLDLVKPKESRNGLYCFSEENRVNSQVTCESNQDNVAKGLLCKSGVPCVCLNGYYLKDNKCEKCRVEDG